MNINKTLRILLLSAGLAVTLFAGRLLAQSYDEQARTILTLFEAGKKDTAYALLEPLKSSARLVPSVLYTRAQMTPDDRALALYKEIIALEPGGPWADKALFQLVTRYVEKRDSLAAQTWTNVLRTNYPRSPLVPNSEQLLAGVTSWSNVEEEGTQATSRRSADTVRRGTTRRASNTETSTSSSNTPTDSYSGSGMRGYALQVGLFPTRAAADVRVAELKRKNLRAVALSKMVGGKKNYALVVGPYSTIEDATKKKATVSGICDCKAFIVKVQ